MPAYWPAVPQPRITATDYDRPTALTTRVIGDPACDIRAVRLGSGPPNRGELVTPCDTSPARSSACTSSPAEGSAWECAVTRAAVSALIANAPQFVPVGHFSSSASLESKFRCVAPQMILTFGKVDLCQSAKSPQEVQQRPQLINNDQRWNPRICWPPALAGNSHQPRNSSSSTTTAEPSPRWRPRIPGPPVVSALAFQDRFRRDSAGDPLRLAIAAGPSPAWPSPSTPTAAAPGC